MQLVALDKGAKLLGLDYPERYKRMPWWRPYLARFSQTCQEADSLQFLWARSGTLSHEKMEDADMDELCFALAIRRQWLTN